MKHPTVLEHLRVLIESKLQLIDFQTTVLLDKLSNTERGVPVEEFPDFLAAANFSVEDFLSCIETYSATKKRLLLLRSLSDEQNSIQILDLLMDNQFMQIPENELLDKPTFAPRLPVLRHHEATTRPLMNDF